MRRIFLAAASTATAVALGAPTAMAASVTSDGTTATYTASPGVANQVTASTGPTPGQVRIRDDAETIPVVAPCNPGSDGNEVVCPASRVVVNTLDNEDSINGMGLTAHPATMNAGADADAMQAGPQPDVINGEGGEDAILVGGFVPGDGGADRVDGGSGDDFFFLPRGPDEIIGGSGVDRVAYYAVEFSGGTAVPVAFTLDDQADDGTSGQGLNVHADVEDLFSVITSIQEAGYTGSGPPWYFGPPVAVEGKATLRGTAGPNTLAGGTGGDDLDALAGNDSLIGGDGDDTLRAVDGFADRLKCGPGADTAIADQLDEVSDSCETVQRSEAPNANEDRPPTVAFASPAPGAITTGATALTANAADDRGVPTVQFFDDDRIVCTDDAPPYTCDYQPRGDDVGRNTLSVVAIDSAQQTASDRRAFTVPRFGAPVSLRLRPARDVTAPFSFRATGRLALPATVAPALGCARAFVAVQVKAGGTTISNRRVRLKPDCTYSSRVSFASRSRFKTRRALRVYAVFAGNDVLASVRSSVRSFRVR
jgi:hypothetical protein